MPKISHSTLKIPSPTYIHLLEPDHLCDDVHDLLVYRDKLGLVASLLHWENKWNGREAIVFYYPTSDLALKNDWKFEHFGDFNEALSKTKLITNNWRDEQAKTFNLSENNNTSPKEFINDNNGSFVSLDGRKIYTKEKISLLEQNEKLKNNANRIKLINLTNRFREENFLNDFRKMISNTKLFEHINTKY